VQQLAQLMFFVPPPPIGIGGDLQVLSSVCVCLSASAWASLLAHLKNQWMEFHQTLADDVIEASDKRIRFPRFFGSRSRSLQGRMLEICGPHIS